MIPLRLARPLAALALLAAASCAVRTEPPGRPALRGRVALLAASLAGLPYVYGGGDIDGFDCSGLVAYVYDCFGIRLPRSAREQSRLGRAVRLHQAQPGDILAFRLKKSWHTAIFLGQGSFVHAPSSGGWVRVEILNDYWLPRLKAVIAVLPDAAPRPGEG